jgi:hypothetical protein
MCLFNFQRFRAQLGNTGPLRLVKQPSERNKSQMRGVTALTERTNPSTVVSYCYGYFPVRGVGHTGSDTVRNDSFLLA